MTLQSIRKNATLEHALLLFFLGVAVYMFVESYSLSERAATFPRFTAALTIVGASLLLFRAYLPGPLQRLVTDSGGAFDDVAGEATETVDGAEELDEREPDAKPEERRADDPVVRTDRPGTATETRYVDLHWFWMNGALFTGLMTTVFVVLSYIAGMLWAAPIFVAGYLTAMRRPWYITTAFTVLAFFTAFAFYYLLGINIADGTVFDLSPFAELLEAQIRGLT